jgi:hypothetical protein
MIRTPNAVRPLPRLMLAFAALTAIATVSALGGCSVDAGGEETQTGSEMNIGEDGGAGLGDAPVDTPPNTCEFDEDLGSAVGDAVSSGTTSGQGDDFTPHCTYDSTSADATFRWTAPLKAVFSIDTLGSDFDTVLHVLAPKCEGRPLACNDEVRPGKKSSEVRISAEQGERFLIVVDGYRAAEGAYVLNIQEEPAASEALSCGDGLDNDRDGDTDCADYECKDSELCEK